MRPDVLERAQRPPKADRLQRALPAELVAAGGKGVLASVTDNIIIASMTDSTDSTKTDASQSRCSASATHPHVSPTGLNMRSRQMAHLRSDSRYVVGLRQAPPLDVTASALPEDRRSRPTRRSPIVGAAGGAEDATGAAATSIAADWPAPDDLRGPRRLSNPVM